jgi:hypothetical protein
MSDQVEVRFVVGSPSGRRSSAWKFIVRGSDVYILTRMFGSEAKVSLHASGQCQWSRSDKWVTQAPGRRNADRHIVKWSMPRQIAREAVIIFQIRIPETELRILATEEDLLSVQWLSPPPPGTTTSLECYITPVSKADPTLANTTPHPCILSLPMADGRWFVVLHYVAPMNGRELAGEREKMVRQMRAAGVRPGPQHRGGAFTIGPMLTHGFIELCPTAV